MIPVERRKGRYEKHDNLKDQQPSFEANARTCVPAPPPLRVRVRVHILTFVTMYVNIGSFRL